MDNIEAIQPGNISWRSRQRTPFLEALPTKILNTRQIAEQHETNVKGCSYHLGNREEMRETLKGNVEKQLLSPKKEESLRKKVQITPS